MDPSRNNNKGKICNLEPKNIIRPTQGFTYGFSKPIQGIDDVPASDTELVAKVCGSLAGLNPNDPPFEVSVECYPNHYEVYAYGYTLPIDFEQFSTLRYGTSPRVMNVRYEPLRSSPLNGFNGAICIVVQSNAGVSSQVILKQTITDSDSLLKQPQQQPESISVTEISDIHPPHPPPPTTNHAHDVENFKNKRRDKLRANYLKDPNPKRFRGRKKSKVTAVEKVPPRSSFLSSIFGGN